MWFTKAWDFTSSVVVSAGRMFYSIGQTYFGQKHAGKYFFGSQNHPASTTFAVLGMLGDLGVQTVIKMPTICRMMGPNREPQPEQPRPETRMGNIVYQSLLASSTVNGAFYLLLAYFGALTLSDLIAELADENVHDKDWEKITIHMAALTVLFSAYRSYRNINHFNFKHTVRKIVHAVETGDYEIDKVALAKTLSVSLLNTLAIPALTTFWVSSALIKIPYAYKIGTAGKDILLTFAGVSGLVTTSINTIPTVYDYFTKKHPVYHHSQLSHAVCYAAVFAGTLDASNAAIFMLISMIEFTNADGFKPYGSSLGLAVPAAVSAGITYALCTVYSGHLDTLQDIHLMQTEDMLPLLREDVAHYGTINETNQDAHPYSEIITWPERSDRNRLDKQSSSHQSSQITSQHTLFAKSKSYEDLGDVAQSSQFNAPPV